MKNAFLLAAICWICSADTGSPAEPPRERPVAFGMTMGGGLYTAFDLGEGANQWRAGTLVGLRSTNLANGATKQWTLPIRNVFASYLLRWRITRDGIYALSGDISRAGQQSFYSWLCTTDVLPLLEPGWEKPGADPLRLRRAQRCCKGNFADAIIERAPFYDLIPTGKDTCAIYADGDDTFNFFERHAIVPPPGGGLITTNPPKRFPLIIREPFWAVPAGDSVHLVAESGIIRQFFPKTEKLNVVESFGIAAKTRCLLIDSDTSRGYAFFSGYCLELSDPPRHILIEPTAHAPETDDGSAAQLECAKALVEAGIIKLPKPGDK